MFRFTLKTLKYANNIVRPLLTPNIAPAKNLIVPSKNASTLLNIQNSCHKIVATTTENHLFVGLSQRLAMLQISNSIGQQQQIRSVTKFSLKKGKRKSVTAVLKRFKRLEWGGWIRTRCGRNKKLWKKSKNLKRRLRQHVLVNGTQAWLLDKMVTSYWRRPRHYIDDPYRPYHQRDYYFATKKQPSK